MRKYHTFTSWLKDYIAKHPHPALTERERALMEQAWEDAHEEGYSMGNNDGYESGCEQTLYRKK